jgi:hypothetical protein
MIGEAIAGIFGKVLDKVIPDPAQKAQAAIEMERLKQSGEFKELDSAMQAILAEANSQDPWTSRARPSFMYVFYFILLALVIAAPIIGVFKPAEMKTFFENVKFGFEAVPEALWWTFSAGYLGYTTARTYEKKVGAAK